MKVSGKEIIEAAGAAPPFEKLQLMPQPYLSWRGRVMKVVEHGVYRSNVGDYLNPLLSDVDCSDAISESLTYNLWYPGLIGATYTLIEVPFKEFSLRGRISIKEIPELYTGGVQTLQLFAGNCNLGAILNLSEIQYVSLETREFSLFNNFNWISAPATVAYRSALRWSGEKVAIAI